MADTSTKNESSPTLAQQQAQSLQQPSTPASNPLLRPAYRFKRLLLVDDNPINPKAPAAVAQRTGLAYATAYDGAEAVRLYKKGSAEGETPFDCIFMDISMPTMNGYEATSAIRQFEDQQRTARGDSGESRAEDGDESSKTKGRRSHIVALTGLGSEEARAKAMNSGCDLFLVKPVKFWNLELLLRM